MTSTMLENLIYSFFDFSSLHIFEVYVENGRSWLQCWPVTDQMGSDDLLPIQFSSQLTDYHSRARRLLLIWMADGKGFAVIYDNKRPNV